MQITQLVVAVLIGVVGAVILTALWSAVYRKRAQTQAAEAKAHAERIIEDARRSAEARLKESSLEAKETLLQARTEFDKQSRERKDELKVAEKRIQQKEENLDKKLQQMERRNDNTASIEQREFQRPLRRPAGSDGACTCVLRGRRDAEHPAFSFADHARLGHRHRGIRGRPRPAQSPRFPDAGIDLL